MNELFFWLLGSAVPIAIVIMTYFGWLNNYLSIKNAYSNCQFMSDICKGYVITKLHIENAMKNKIRWSLFGSRYIDLLNYHADKLLHEVDHLTTFESSKENTPLYRRHSFMDQWNEINKMFLYKDSLIEGQVKTTRELFGKDPLGWMSVIIEGKIFELYRKYVLHILRTKGYREFNETVCLYDKSSSLYPDFLPMSAIHNSINKKLIYDSRIEIAERIWNEWNSQPLRIISEHQTLVKTFVYKQTMVNRDKEIIEIEAKIQNRVVY